MRRPDRHRAIAATVALAGTAVFLVALENHDPRDGGRPLVALVVFGMLTPIVYAAMAHVQSRRYSRLLKGEGLIGRWTVGPQVWRAFHAELGRPVPDDRPDGVDVLVGESASAVDGDFRYFPVTGDQKVVGVRFIDGAAPYLAFEILTRSRHNDTTGHHCVPVDPEARESALRVVDNYMTRIAEVERRAAA